MGTVKETVCVGWEKFMKVRCFGTTLISKKLFGEFFLFVSRERKMGGKKERERMGFEEWRRGGDFR